MSVNGISNNNNVTNCEQYDCEDVQSASSQRAASQDCSCAPPNVPQQQGGGSNVSGYYTYTRVGHKANAQEVAKREGAKNPTKKDIEFAKRLMSKANQNPVQLKDGTVLYKGRVYRNMDRLQQDLADGKQDNLGGEWHSSPAPPQNGGNTGPGNGGNTDPGNGGNTDPGNGGNSGSDGTRPQLLSGLTSDLSPYTSALSTIDGDIEKLKTYLKGNPKDTQAMMELQDLQQSKSMLVSMVTNMLKSEHDAAMEVTRNMKA